MISIKSNNKKINAIVYADEKNLHEGIFRAEYFCNFKNIDSLDVTVVPVSSVGPGVASKKTFKINKCMFF